MSPCPEKPLPLCLCPSLGECQCVGQPCLVMLPMVTQAGQGWGNHCAQLCGVSSSPPGRPWLGIPWDRHSWARGMSHGHSLTWGQLSGSTLGSAASKGAAGGREQQVLLVFLHCFLFHVSHTPTRSTSHSSPRSLHPGEEQKC